MATRRLLELLNKICDLFILGPPNESPIGPHRLYGADSENPISASGNHSFLFNTCIKDLIELLPEVKGTISTEAIINELMPRIQRAKVAGIAFTLDDAESFALALSDLPILEFGVVRRIYGVEMSPESTSLPIGDFLIGYGRDIYRTASGRLVTSITQLLGEKYQDQIFIQCKVKARNAEQACELGDVFFRRFELIFCVFAGCGPERIEVGIMNYIGPQKREQIVMAENGRIVRTGGRWMGAIQPFLLKDPRFPMPTGPYARLFELITRDGSDFEKHVMRCAEWTGQAISELNPASALVKAAIALETMFSGIERGPIVPSVMAQIAECCAFVLFSDKTSPLEVEGEVKRLYGIRSKIVHSGSDSVDIRDLETFISLCRRVVFRLLSDKEFAQITTMSELTTYFKRKKYSLS
jgi:hypothetical protein